MGVAGVLKASQMGSEEATGLFVISAPHFWGAGRSLCFSQSELPIFGEVEGSWCFHNQRSPNLGNRFGGARMLTSLLDPTR